jgi:hypothetical protein
MAVFVKIEYQDEIAVIEEGTKAEEKQGFLFVYDKDGAVTAKFKVSQIEHWWIGSAKKQDDF